MKVTSLRQAVWGPSPAFDATPVYYRDDVREDEGYVLLALPELPELGVAAAPGEDLAAKARGGLEDAVRARLVEWEDALWSGTCWYGAS